MKLREICRYEIAYCLARPSTWVYGVCLFLVAGWMFLATSEGAGEAMLNSPLRLVGAYVRPGMFGMLVSAILFGGAAVRDVQTGMWPLVYTTPARRHEYLGGRFLGALAVNAMLLAAVPLGILAAIWAFGGQVADQIEPLRPLAHVQAYLFFLLPNTVLVGAILFAIGMLGRQMVAVYLGAIGIFIGSVVAMNYASALQGSIAGSLLDPFGMMSIEYVTRYWTLVERNERLINLPAQLAWNRGVWLAVAGIALGATYLRFRFSQINGAERGRSEGGRADPPDIAVAPVLRIPGTRGSFGTRTTVRQSLAIARQLLSQIMVSRWFVVVMLACAGMPLLWGWNVGETVFDTSTWPVTFLIAEVVLAQRSTLLFLVLILVFVGELVWRERDVGAAHIMDAAPVSDGAVLVGRFLAIAVLIVLFQVGAMAGGLLIQALQGYYRFEPGLYLQVLFGLKLTDYLLLAALAMAIHLLVNHKNLAHIASLMLMWLTFVAGPLLGIHHHLLIYGTDPGWTYSDMNGFGPFLQAFAWFKLYWASWAVLLLVLASLLRARGAEQDLRSRIRRAHTRLSRATVTTGAAAAAGILGFGGFIYYNTNILHEYVSPPQQGGIQAEYEKRYGRYAALPQPTIVDAALRIEIYPDQPAVECSGSYGLINASSQAIERVHVYVGRDVAAHSMKLDRAFTAELLDESVGYRIFKLERPLAPGESARLEFECAFRPRGFGNERNRIEVVANGTLFHRSLMPFVGYQPAFELADDETRTRFGLAARPPTPGPDDREAVNRRWHIRDADLVQVDAVIGTSEGQTAVTPGELRRTWTENGRRYFHYRTRTPISFGGTVFSGEYAVREDRWNDVTLQIFHHPAHDFNIDRMMSAMKASLAYYTEQFGPYPYRQARIVEFPRYGGHGHAHPETIGFSEDAFLSRVKEDEADQPFFGVAHELAHTWWGGMVRGGRVRGAEFLSESLANYCALMVVEKTYGRDAARKVYGFQLERYLRGRAEQSREVPVLDVEDQPYIAYRKGAIALYQLRERIGEEAVNGAIRRYFEKYAEAGPPYPTSLDLYAELQAVTPAAHQTMLKDLFEEVTLWDVAAKTASVEPSAAGGFDVTIEVTARKVRADRDGLETELPMDEMVEVGIFAGEETKTSSTPMYLQPHRIQSGNQMVRVTVPEAPTHAGIDPNRMLIDRDAADNRVQVRAK